jgi:hypothetical protein
MAASFEIIENGLIKLDVELLDLRFRISLDGLR